MHTGEGYLRFYPGIENLILPRLSYSGCNVRATCIGCIGTHADGRQAMSLLCLSDIIMYNCILAYSGSLEIYFKIKNRDEQKK